MQDSFFHSPPTCGASQWSLSKGFVLPFGQGPVSGGLTRKGRTITSFWVPYWVWLKLGVSSSDVQISWAEGSSLVEEALLSTCRTCEGSLPASIAASAMHSTGLNWSTSSVTNTWRCILTPFETWLSNNYVVMNCAFLASKSLGQTDGSRGMIYILKPVIYKQSCSSSSCRQIERDVNLPYTVPWANAYGSCNLKHSFVLENPAWTALPWK